MNFSKQNPADVSQVLKKRRKYRPRALLDQVFGEIDEVGKRICCCSAKIVKRTDALWRHTQSCTEARKILYPDSHKEPETKQQYSLPEIQHQNFPVFSQSQHSNIFSVAPQFNVFPSNSTLSTDLDQIS